MHHVKNVDEVYQVALKDEDKLAKNLRKRPFIEGAMPSHQ